MTAEVCLLLKAQGAAYREEDKAALCSARCSPGIKAAKTNYVVKIQENLEIPRGFGSGSKR